MASINVNKSSLNKLNKPDAGKRNKIMKTSIKIYVGTYGQYNNGSLFGKWFDFADYSNAEELCEAITEYHKDEADPEYMIQDTDCEYSFLSDLIGESSWEDDFQKVYDLMQEIEDSYYDIEVFEAYAKCFGNDFEVSDVEEAYAGEHDSDKDFAQDMAEQCGTEIPNTWPLNCIDWEWAARQLMYDYCESNGHYFRNC